jgi:hypothetical protein
MPNATSTYTIRASDKTKLAFKSIKANMAAVSGRVLNLRTALVGLAGVAGFGAVINASLKANDALAKTADKLGIATEKYQGLTHAAELTGVKQETLNKALTRQQKAIFDADRGLLTYKQHFDTLNLSTERLKKLSPDQQFVAIAEALKKVENQTVKNAIAYDIFGGRGTALLNTLNLGQAGLEATTQEVADLGAALSRVDAAKIEAANDSFTRVSLAIKGIVTRITVALAPYLEYASNLFIKAAKDSNGFADETTAATEWVIMALAKVSDVIQGIRFAWAGLKLAFAAGAEIIIKVNNEIAKSFLKVMQYIPGMGDFAREGIATLDAVAGAASDRTAKLKAELDAIAAEGLPSESVTAALDLIKSKATEAGAAVAAVTRPKPGGFEEGGADDPQALEREKTAKHQQTLEEMTAAHLNNLLRQERQAAAQKQALWKSGARGQLQIAGGILGDLSTLMMSENKKQFEIGKAAATGQAIIETYLGAQRAFSSLAGIPIVGPALGAAAAAAAILAGMARVQAIQSQSFGGGAASVAVGGGGVSVGTGAPVNPAPPAASSTSSQPPPQEVNITLVGRQQSTEDVDDLLQIINDRLGDGVRLNVAVST